jgi:hypothetical protein
MISKLYEDSLRSNNGHGAGAADRSVGFDRFLFVCSVLVGAIYLFSDGSVFTAVSLVGLAAVVVLTLYRLDWGFMFFVAVVLAFDQFPPSGYDRTIIGVEYFQNLKSQKFLANVDFAVANPLELHFLLIFVTWVFLIIMKKKVVLRKVHSPGPIIIFFLWLTMSAAVGVARGGDFLPALWELRALFYLGILYFFVPQIIQSRAQVIQLFWAIIAALAFKTFQGMVRVVNLGFSFGNRTQLTSHEDPLFFISLFMLMAGLFMFRGRHAQRKVLVWLFLPMLAVFFLAQRRATWAALGACTIAYFVLMDGGPRKKFIMAVTPFLIAGSVYMAAFWDSPPSGFGYGAHLLRSSFTSEKEEAGDRYYSNLYRDFENYNLAQTAMNAPLFGIGFGQKYEQPIKLVKIPFPLAEYIPHNEILWLFVKMGAIGFFLFWFFLFSYISRATALFRRLRDPYLKSVCAVTILAVLGQVICSFYDLQLTYARNMVFLGTLLGLYPVLERAAAGQDDVRTAVLRPEEAPV